jgi:hypothetical protein
MMTLPATVDDAHRKDALRQTLRALVAAGDTASVKEIGKEAYATCARLANEMRPHKDTLDVVQDVILELLVNDGREAVNDPDFVIALEEKKSARPITDQAALYDALHALTVDGEPIPEELLREAAYIDLPPPPLPAKVTNLTKIKPLIKRFGKPIQDAIDACVSYSPSPRRLIFRPKEKHAGNPINALTH